MNTKSTKDMDYTESNYWAGIMQRMAVAALPALISNIDSDDPPLLMDTAELAWAYAECMVEVAIEKEYFDQ